MLLVVCTKLMKDCVATSLKCQQNIFTLSRGDNKANPQLFVKFPGGNFPQSITRLFFHFSATLHIKKLRQIGGVFVQQIAYSASYDGGQILMKGFSIAVIIETKLFKCEHNFLPIIPNIPIRPRIKQIPLCAPHFNHLFFSAFPYFPIKPDENN